MKSGHSSQTPCRGEFECNGDISTIDKQFRGFRVADDTVTMPIKKWQIRSAGPAAAYLLRLRAHRQFMRLVLRTLSATALLALLFLALSAIPIHIYDGFESPQLSRFRWFAYRSSLTR